MGAEARRSPRYARQLDVNVEGLEIVTSNVSNGGVQLCCPEMRYRGFKRSADINENIALKIRIPGSHDWVQIAGVVRYADLCDDEYLIGFQFTSYVNNAQAGWESYLATLAHLTPVD